MKNQTIIGSVSTANQSKKALTLFAGFSIIILACLFTASHEAIAMQNQEVTIRTQDGKEFKVSVPLAEQSVTIKNIIQDAGIGQAIPLPNIASSVWTKVQELLPHVQTNNTKAIEDALKAFDGLTLVAFIAAVNYLDIPILLNASIDIAKRIDDAKIKNISPKQIAALPKEIRNPIIRAQMERTLGPLALKELAEIQAGTRAVSLTQDGSKILSAGINGIRIYDLESQKELAMLKMDTRKVSTLCVTPDGRKIALGFFDKDNTIGIWDLEYHEQLAVLKGHRRSVVSLFVTPDGSKLVSGSQDAEIRIWDLENYKNLAVLKGHRGGIESFVVTPDGSKIVSGDLDETIIIWDLESYKLLAKLWAENNNVWSLCVTPDGKKIVSGGERGVIRIWDLEQRKELGMLKGHTGMVEAVCVTPDGSKIIAGASDGTIRIWDLESHKELAVLRGHTSSIFDVYVTPDGRKIVSGSEDRTIRIWGDLFALDLQEEDFAQMNAEQAQQIWEYLQSEHTQGWGGIVHILKQSKK